MLWFPIAWPRLAISLTMSGCAAAVSPTQKKLALAPKNHIRGIFDLHQAPVISREEMPRHRTVLGGDLIQDIPSEVNGALHHAVAEPRYALAHEVWVSPSSRVKRSVSRRVSRKRSATAFSS